MIFTHSPSATANAMNVRLKPLKKSPAWLQVRKHLTIDFDLRAIGGSALTDRIKVPKGRSASDIAHGIPITYVPARNTIFLSFGLAFAEKIEAPDIFFGANQLDYSGYPDCRDEYVRAFEKMANLATKAAVEGKIQLKIHTPLIQMTKAEIIRHGTQLESTTVSPGVATIRLAMAKPAVCAIAAS